MELSQNEIRVVGCLMEKAVTTPDQCPLTLNALVAACNQKSSRDPVLSLDRATVQRTARALEEQGFVTSEENFRTGVVKYSQRFCNTAIQRRAIQRGRVRRCLCPPAARTADPWRTAYAQCAALRLRG